MRKCLWRRAPTAASCYISLNSAPAVPQAFGSSRRRAAVKTGKCWGCGVQARKVKRCLQCKKAEYCSDAKVRIGRGTRRACRASQLCGRRSHGRRVIRRVLRAISLSSLLVTVFFPHTAIDPRSPRAERGGGAQSWIPGHAPRMRARRCARAAALRVASATDTRRTGTVAPGPGPAHRLSWAPEMGVQAARSPCTNAHDDLLLVPNALLFALSRGVGALRPRAHERARAVVRATAARFCARARERRVPAERRRR